MKFLPLDFLRLKRAPLPFRSAITGLLLGTVLCAHALAAPEGQSIATPTTASPNQAMKEEITHVLKEYEKSLNTSDAKLALSLYGSDPVVMPQGAPAFVGREKAQAAYEGFFSTLKLSVTFQIHEIVSMGGDLAYVRTTSGGQQEILATHKLSKEANNEMFIFRQEDGHWKIHRYLFATSNPPAAD